MHSPRIPYRLSLVSAPSVEPVTLAEAKVNLRVDSSSEDAFITSLITVARQKAEKYTKRAFINQTWKMFLDDFFCVTKSQEEWWDGVRNTAISALYPNGAGNLEIPLSPLVSVTSIKTYDNADNPTTFDPSNYQVSIYSGENPQLGRVSLRVGAMWPTALGSILRLADGVEIIFVAGYGSSGSSVPAQIKQGVLAEISYYFENRGDCVDSTGINSPLARGLLEPYRIMEF